MQNDRECWICKKLGLNTPGTDEHHVLHGTANRKLAEADGLKVFLCRYHHSLLHDKGYFDKDLQKEAQQKWQEHYGKTREDFINRYGKNYL